MLSVRRILYGLGACAIVVLMAVGLLWFSAGTAAAGTMMDSKTGDLNLDGVANSLDALHVLFYDAGLSEPPVDDADRWIAAGDVNCDIIVNSLDASLILQADAGLYQLRP